MSFCIRWTKIKEFSEVLCILQPNLGKDNLLGIFIIIFPDFWDRSNLSQLIQDSYRIDGTPTDAGRHLIREYTFKENYYFTAGDNGLNSRDSRYWGPVPEPFIVGVASRIWKSVDKYTGEWRSDRFLKGIE